MGQSGVGGMEGELPPVQEIRSQKRKVLKEKFRREHRFRFNAHRGVEEANQSEVG